MIVINILQKKNVDRLSRESEPVAGTSGLCRKQSRASVDKTILFAEDCIFCNKEGAVKKSGSWTTECTQKFQSDAWKAVVPKACRDEEDEKLLVSVRGCDLFASEAHFHPNCRKKYIIDHQNRKKY